MTSFTQFGIDGTRFSRLMFLHNLFSSFFNSAIFWGWFFSNFISSSSIDQSFDLNVIHRVRRPFLLPLNVNLESLEACSSIMASSSILIKSYFSNFIFRHFLWVIGTVETTHHRQKGYLKTGLVMADRKIIHQLFVSLHPIFLLTKRFLRFLIYYKTFLI